MDIEIDRRDDFCLAEELGHVLKGNAAHYCRSLFHGAKGEATHELFLREPADDENGGDRHHRGGRELGPEQPLR